MAKQGFEFDAPGESPGLILWRMTTAWQRSIHEALAPFDLTHPQFVLLASSAWLASTGKKATQAAISELSNSDPNTVSAMLKRLEHKGLAVRNRGTHDLRTRLVAPTEAGHQLLAKVVPLVEAADVEFFADGETTKQLSKLAQISKGLNRLGQIN